MKGIAKCFECQKLATVKCLQCLDEFEEPKNFCYICDSAIHKQLQAIHQKETIQFNRQLDHLNNQPSYHSGQSNLTNLDRRVPQRQNDQKSEQIRQDSRQYNQLSLQDNPRDNLLFFKDLKYSSNNPSVRSNLSENRFKSTGSVPIYSNRNQNTNYSSNEFQKRDLQSDSGRCNTYQSNTSYERYHNNPLSTKSRESKFTEEFEQMYQHKLNMKRGLNNRLLENTQSLNRDHDSFLSNEEDKHKHVSNPLQQGLSDEEGENKAFKQNQGLKNKNYQSQERSDQFKQKIEQEINELKKYQNVHYNKQNPAVIENKDHHKQEDEKNTLKWNEKKPLNQNDKLDEQEQKILKDDFKQHFGNQKDLDDRENEILKRIGEIKQKMSPQTGLSSAHQQISDTERGNILIHNYHDKSSNVEPAPLSVKNTFTKNQRLITRNDRKEQDYQNDKAGSHQKNDFENLISLVGPNEEKSYIDGLKNVYQQEIKNIEIKNKIKVQELENTISYMRQHMELMEERNKENIVQVQEELQKQQRIAIEQERDSKYGINELSLQYKQEIHHLQLQVETEKARNIQLEKKILEYQTHYQHKLREMADLTKKAKLEAESEKVKLQECIDGFEEKIEDMRVRMVQENENSLQKIKVDYESSIEDLKDQLKQKSEQIAKIEKQLVLESQQYHEKESELKKENQELEKQITNERSEKSKIQGNTQQFKYIATEQEGELELMRRENELLEFQKKKLEEEKIRLEDQMERYQKYIYGDKKEKSIIQSLKAQSNKPSISLSSVTSIKSASNSKRKI